MVTLLDKGVKSCVTIEPLGVRAYAMEAYLGIA